MSISRIRKVNLWFMAAVCLMVLLVGATAARAVWWQTTQLTADSFNAYDPQVSGNNVVWYDDSGPGNTYEIILYNGSTTTALTNNALHDSDPQVSGNNVAWSGLDGVDYEIYLYNGSTVTTLTANSFDDYAPKVSGNNVAWRGYGGPGGLTSEIYLYDGSAVTTLTANSFNDEAPQVSGNNVVWQGAGGPSGTSEIYLYDGSAVTTLTANSFNDWDPQVSGNNIVWYGEGGPGNTNEIYLYNGSAVTTLTANSFNDWDPQVSGNNIVWYGEGGPGVTNEIYLYNGSTTTALTNNAFDDAYPKVSGNNVVWYGEGGPSGTTEIYLFNGSTVTTLTANSFNDYDPQISGNNVVWWGYGGPGITSEIYRAQLDGVSPSDPNVTGSTPAKDAWTNDNTIFVNFVGASDNLSGVDGYSIDWSNAPLTLPDAVKDLEESAGSALSPPLADGNQYFHLRTLDNAGNWTSTIHYGPFKIDTASPTAFVKAPAKVKTAAGTARFRISWSGSDSGSGVKTYDVGYKIGKRGRWKSWKTGATALRARFTAKVGKTYYFRARAKDAAGNTGAWSRLRRTVVSKR